MRLTAVLLIGLTWYSATSARAFHWTSVAVPQVVAGEDVDTKGEGSYSNDLSIVFEKAAQLESYAGKNSCFQRAAGAIRVRCGQLDMDESQRIRAAIEMTLCELATANHSPPLECVALTDDTELTEGRNGLQPLNACVEALSRSAQYWSSYSGYLRELPQLCHAFRRWHDIDIAKETYRNATLDVISLLRTVLGQTEKSRVVHSEFDDLLQAFRRSFTDMHMSQSELARASTAMNDLVAHVTDEAATLLGSMTSSFMEAMERNSRYAAEEANGKIGHMLDLHAAALGAMVPDAANAIRSQLLSLVSDAALHVQQLELHARSITVVWDDLNRNVGLMQDSVVGLIADASEAATRLAVQSSQAALAQRTQQDAMRSAAELAVSLGVLADRTREEMREINLTALAVREELVSAKNGVADMFTPPWWTVWSDYGAAWLAQTLLGVDRPDVVSFMHLPIIRIGSLFLHLICYLLRTGISSVMSSALLLFSLSRWLQSNIPPWSKLSRLPGTTGTGPLHPPTLVLPPPRLVASLAPRAAPTAPKNDNGFQRRRFSRIPERLVRPL